MALGLSQEQKEELINRFFKEKVSEREKKAAMGGLIVCGLWRWALLMANDWLGMCIVHDPTM